MKIVVVGGGSAGWMTASYLQKKLLNSSVTLVESPRVSTIGVGESVTVHVTRFISELGIDEKHMMQETGSVYKFGNNFVGWDTGTGESELFPFRWNITLNDIKKVLKSSENTNDTFTALKRLHNYNLSTYIQANAVASRFTDYWLELYKQNRINNDFGCSFGGYDYFSKHEKMPARDSEHLFEQKGLQHAYHINAEKFGEYMKTHVGLPAGVEHVVAHIDKVAVSGNSVQHIILENGEQITADLFIDCSGFNRVLVKHLDKQWKHYDLNPADSAIVCQVNYDDPSKDLVNHTLSIAQDQGWVFDISLFHRKGTGYIYSSALSNEQQVIKEYTDNFLTNARTEPRKITWEKKRLQKSAEGNVVAIGMSNGFVEPMEANLFAIIINGIWHLTSTLYKQGVAADWSSYNTKMADTYDDIADFVLVHYTLSNRQGAFWDEMRSIGKQHNHKQLLIDKYKDARNTFLGAGQGHSIFVDYMWLQLALGWKLNVDNWPTKNIQSDDLDIVESYISSMENKTIECAKDFPNNYQYLKDKIFNGSKITY